MRGSDIISIIGFSLVGVAVILLFLVSWILGLVFSIFAAAVIVWYIRRKKSGDIYLRELARFIGCDFESGGFGYGIVIGSYRGHEIEIKINQDYDSNKGLSGFIISSALLESTSGLLAGIKNFASVKIKHAADIVEPYKLDSRTFVDNNLIMYLPPSDVTGMPTQSVKSLIRKINGLIKVVSDLEKV
jgi:hypothetical protein